MSDDLRRHKVSIYIHAEDLLTGKFILNENIMKYFTGRSTFDFDRNKHGFRFTGNPKFPIHIDGEAIPVVTFQELEDMCQE